MAKSWPWGSHIAVKKNNISRKVRDHVDFRLFVLWPGMPKVSKIMFAIPCNFAKRRRRIDILPEKKKHQSFPEADTVVFCDHSEACPKYAKL